ncbi:YifB family Mg chelatase-like AAA ATPase [Actinospica sp. MGRD01-02]|uniref:YifB family Mg chelatase-like AAA ATPase n=1 Tax=Actinospica acidithermotolerans TaxID=2828514 RepID=A0A941E4D9_9ACTN|nr:YifB family Mg chelatase-like AAA ATPase [Actinospica acidithermotolerans]MBR7824896.1 YifB family Mg chelatase-like AAA ATPase [Actinospica acidithermotolerans]
MAGYGRASAVALLGLSGVLVQAEAVVTAGLSRFSLIGLPDTGLSESRDRVRAAVINSAISWPQTSLTVSLAPASIRKQGSSFDLAIAIAVLRADGKVRPAGLSETVFIAELGLDGSVRPVRGVLPSVLAAARAGYEKVCVAEDNLIEAEQVTGVSTIGVRTLRQAVAYANGEPIPDEPSVPVLPRPVPSPSPNPDTPDMADVLGQFEARLALEVSATGGHHLFLCGAPGSGKTMLAERLPGLLPPLDERAALEVTAVHSLAGTLHPAKPLVTEPPFCAVHHSATVPALVGGGAAVIRPGAVSRAHRGVLFLDEAPEFGRVALDSLREPIESREVVIARSAGVATFPADFLLVAAANPCPCGLAMSTHGACTCSSRSRSAYLGRISGPLLDRIDLRVDVSPVGSTELLAAAAGGLASESTAQVADRVRQARDRAVRRLRDTPWRLNAQVPARFLRTHWPLGADSLEGAEQALEAGVLTARGLDRVLRVAWTLADLAGRDRPGRTELDTALSFRLSTTFHSGAFA